MYSMIVELMMTQRKEYNSLFGKQRGSNFFYLFVKNAHI